MFHDLVAFALLANTDLRAATANLRTEQAVLGEARRARLPQTTISAGATYGRLQPLLYLLGNRFTCSAGMATREQKSRLISERRSDQAFRLADLRYRSGSIARIETDRALAASRVALFGALGGSWLYEGAVR